jgi:gliding motility-associated-like protein
LDYVSVNPDDNFRVDGQWTIENSEQVNGGGITLYKNLDESVEWIPKSFLVGPSFFSDDGNVTGNHQYRFYVSFTSTCAQVRSSAVHSIVRLLGEPDNENDKVLLTWSPYEGWPEGVDHYEVWAKFDTQESFQLISTLSSNETETALPSVTAFDHTYRIRAIEKNGPNESLSNATGLFFDHKVFVPNVITPNGDGFNQFFNLKNIHLFPENHLQIIDRWGKKVFETRNYQNTWDGTGQESGVYYFVLTIAQGNQVIRGTISVVR